MTPSTQKAEQAPAWKQEVNRRVAQHKGRKGNASNGEDASTDGPAGITSAKPVPRASAKAAARVAARYAKAPSYSQMLAEEIGAGRGGSIAAPRLAACDAAAAAVLSVATVYAETETPSAEAAPGAETRPVQPTLSPAPERAFTETLETEPVFSIAVAETADSVAPTQRFAIRWEADLPVRDHAAALGRASRGEGIYEVDAETVWKHGREGRDAFYSQGLEMVEAAQPIHANLIHFPKELIAARKARPRRAESAFAASMEAQLSIFEAEPLPLVDEFEEIGGEASATTLPWRGPEWSSIQLERELRAETATPEKKPLQAEPAKASLAEQVAPMSRRMLAGLVDFSLVTGAFLGAAFTAVMNATVLPSLKAMELGSIAAVVLVGLFYYAFFFSLSKATLGMRYAGLAMRTFSGKRPNLKQRCARAAALVISIMPVGLGAVWALFDEDNLCWHDRLSSTYLRRE